MPAEFERIRVVVRVRPFSNYELEQKNDCVVSCSGDTLTVQNGSEFKCFTYDATYWSVDGRTARYASQEVIYEDVGAGMFANALDGYNGCIFAYGQTGSGKSYTMLGIGSEASDLGIIPRTVESIFAVKSAMEAPGPDQGELRVWAASAEIYNDRIRDLLQPSSSPNELKVLDHPELGVCIPGLVFAACLTAADIRKLWAFSNRKRATAATNMNAVSSRSHAVFMIKIQRLEGGPPPKGVKDERKIISAQLNFMDLAGSERVSRRSKSTRTKDARSINSSLSALATVIKALCEQQMSVQPKHIVVPFRASKLTYVMKDALCGNSKTTLIATITPASDSLYETLDCLQFADSVKPLSSRPSKNLGIKIDQITHALHAEVKQLKAKRSIVLANAVDEQGCSLVGEQYREEIVQREALLRHLSTPYEKQLEEAVTADRIRDEALRKLGLTSSLIDEVFGIESNTPYILNMSSDPMLVGCLIYFLHPGVKTRIGANAKNDIVLTGLGMPDFLCTIENLDQQTIVLSAADTDGNGNAMVKANVRTNGSLLLFGESRRLQHLDYLIFGRAHAMRLTVPSEQKRLAGSDAAALRAAQGLYESSMLRLLIPEESESWNELRLYFEDLWQRLGEERGKVFFSWLIEASHLVDEANEITAEMRPEDRLKFEVELVWDIHREANDIIVIRAMQFPVGEGDAAVLCYWSLDTFKDRVVMMRDCFDTFHRTGDWPGKGDPLADPWMDPSAVELRLRMQMVEDAELKVLDETVAALDVEDGSLSKSLAIVPGLSGQQKPMPKRRAAVSTSSNKRNKSPPRASSARTGSERAPQTRTRLNGERGAQTKKSPKPASPPIPWRGGGGGSFRSPSEERRGLPAMERVIVARGASPGAQQRDGMQPSEEQHAVLQSTPPAIALTQQVLPDRGPSTSISEQQEPDAEPSTKDAIIAALRQQLVNKENDEMKYKGQITDLWQKLTSLERQHGPLISLASEPERQTAPPILRSTLGSSHLHMPGSIAVPSASSSKGFGSLVRSHAASTVPAMIFSPPPLQGGRTLLSGRLDTASLISSASAGPDANLAFSGLGPSPQRMSSSRSSPAHTIETPLTSGSRSLIVPPAPSRQASSASSFVASRPLTSNATIATTVSAIPLAPILYN